MTAPKSLPFLFRSVLVAAALFVGATAFNPAWTQELSTHNVEREANAGNFDKAYEVLVQLAESGNAQAQGFLAYVLYQGEWGVSVDEAKAKKWMQAALDQNNAYAHLFVGLSNAPDNADQTAKDPSLIVSHDWKANIRIAAENGHPYAQHMMSQWADTKREALEWLRKASGRNAFSYRQDVRDYYAVDYYLLKGPRLHSGRFKLAEIGRREGSGNGAAYVVLAIAHTYGLQVGRDYEEAYIYATLGSLMHSAISMDVEDIKLLLNVLPPSRKKALKADDVDRISKWAKNPETFIGQAASWCRSVGEGNSLNCLKQAVEDHRMCELEYIGWSFNSYGAFPAYIACRKALYPTP